jgi:hypothetical protein
LFLLFAKTADDALQSRAHFRSREIIVTGAFSPNSESAYEHTNYTTLKSTRTAARFFRYPLLLGRVGRDFCDFAVTGSGPVTSESSCRHEQDRAMGA